ncbi:Alpha-tocopherol transfer protein [Lucilia cuprina]|nr:Alpha-tocopherol transfer protein [Lucilia cuprina]
MYLNHSNDFNIGSEDIFLSKFLFYSNWDVERAFENIRRYYDFKAEHPKWLAHHTVEYFRGQFLDIKAKFLMPTPDKMGRPIVIFKSVDCFNKYPNYLQDLIEMDDLVFESLLLIPQVQERGITIIFDINGITRNFLPMLSPRLGRLINEKNKVLPFSQRYIHIIQSGFLMNAASSMIMPFLSRDFKEHIFTHDGKNFNKLRDMIGYEYLPAEYGGPITNQLNVDVLLNHLLKHSEYLLKLQTYHKK